MGGVGSGGHNSMYTDELAAEICVRLAMGETLKRICEDQGYPCERTILYWRFSKSKEVIKFKELYDEAREIQCERWAAELVSLADGCVPTKGAVAKMRMRLAERHWVLSKLVANRYGDKIELKVEAPKSTLTINYAGQKPDAA